MKETEKERQDAEQEKKQEQVLEKSEREENERNTKEQEEHRSMSVSSISTESNREYQVRNSIVHKFSSKKQNDLNTFFKH